MKIQEGDANIPIDLRQDPAPFPEPRIFNWSKDGQPLSDDLNVTYSTITFPLVTRNNAGNYMVSATNFLLSNDSSQQLGSDAGTFYLDVLCEQLYTYATFKCMISILIIIRSTIVCNRSSYVTTVCTVG